MFLVRNNPFLFKGPLHTENQRQTGLVRIYRYYKVAFIFLFVINCFPEASIRTNSSYFRNCPQTTILPGWDAWTDFSDLTSEESDLSDSDSLVNSYRTAEYLNNSGFDDVDAALAYALLDKNNKTSDGAGTVVALSGNGIDFTHPELLAAKANCNHRSWENSFAGDIYTDSLTSTKAGIIAATDNDKGIVGIAPGAQLMAINQDFVETIGTAVSDGAFIVALDWTLGADDSYEQADIDFLHDFFSQAIETGGLFIVAAGDSSNTVHGYPVAFAADDNLGPQILIVAGIDESEEITTAGCGAKTDSTSESCLVAPATGFIGPRADGYTDDNAVTLDGYNFTTSSNSAVAIVAAAAALLKAAEPNLTASEIKTALTSSATAKHASGEDTSVVSETFGHGILNIAEAVRVVAAGSP